MNQNLRADEESSDDNTLALRDVQDFIDDEGIDLNDKEENPHKIGF